MVSKNLRTIKKAHEETGASVSYFKQLLREGRLTRYKIHSATYVSLTEFENLAKPAKPLASTSYRPYAFNDSS